MGTLVLFQSVRRKALEKPPERLEAWAQRVHIGTSAVRSADVARLPDGGGRSETDRALIETLLERDDVWNDPE